MYSASCHCGDVRIEVDELPKTATQCNCSICQRYAARWIFGTRRTCRLSSSRDNMTAYLWNDKVIEFYHCNRCGCLTHYEGIEKSDDERFAVNIRMMDPEDIKDIRIRTFDGADTWQYLPDEHSAL